MKLDILDYDMTSAARSTSALTDGYAGTISGETGYGFAFGGNLTLQPQAQLSYTSVSITNYTDSYGIKVGNGAAELLIGRASLDALILDRLEDDVLDGEAGTVRRFQRRAQAAARLVDGIGHELMLSLAVMPRAAASSTARTRQR